MEIEHLSNYFRFWKLRFIQLILYSKNQIFVKWIFIPKFQLLSDELWKSNVCQMIFGSSFCQIYFDPEVTLLSYQFRIVKIEYLWNEFWIQKIEVFSKKFCILKLNFRKINLRFWKSSFYQMFSRIVEWFFTAKIEILLNEFRKMNFHLHENRAFAK